VEKVQHAHAPMCAAVLERMKFILYDNVHDGKSTKKVRVNPPQKDKHAA